jgi:hypothetical protein
MEIRLLFLGASPVGGPDFSFDCTYGFRPNAHKLNPNSDTRKAITNFSTSLHFRVRLRQAESQNYDGAFGEMCRSVYEHSVPADVGRAKWDVFNASFVIHANFKNVREARLAAGRGEILGLFRSLHGESTPCVTSNDDSEWEVAPRVSRLVPQNGQ